jgi:hypothetical protein
MDFIQQTVKTDGDLLQSITHTFPGFKMSKGRPFLNNRLRRNNIHYGMVILQTPTIKYLLLLLLPRPHLLHLYLIAFTRYLNTSSSRTFHSQTTPPGIPWIPSRLLLILLFHHPRHHHLLLSFILLHLIISINYNNNNRWTGPFNPQTVNMPSAGSKNKNSCGITMNKETTCPCRLQIMTKKRILGISHSQSKRCTIIATSLWSTISKSSAIQAWGPRINGHNKLGKGEKRRGMDKNPNSRLWKSSWNVAIHRSLPKSNKN